MLMSEVLQVGLKEWASVCRALEIGRQIMLLRKGGIQEAIGGFELEHPRFVLFPTYLHQNLAMLKAEAHEGFEPAGSEPDTLRLSAAGVVTDILQARSRAQVDALDEQHVWTPPLIDMRFNYRPKNPLYILLVRAHRLAEAMTVRNTPEYAGCKSWVPLREEVSTAGWTPVLDDDTYAARRDLIIGRAARTP
jgi:hypothetical protein